MARHQIDLTEGQEDHEITVDADAGDMDAGVDMTVYFAEGLDPDVKHQLLARAQRVLIRDRSQ